MKRLAEILPHAKIEEVGSTAIKGMLGKNDVDIAIAVLTSDFLDARSFLDAQFKRNDEQFSSEAFQGYTVKSETEIALQLFCVGSSFDVFSEFKDLLSRSAGMRMRYTLLKRRWNGRDMDAYRDAKSKFINCVIFK
ncbi:MAG: GrpB family protein [Pseudomonadota bacterium]|nr:GrpB family protein [Pseudomonadota bacterium]